MIKVIVMIAILQYKTKMVKNKEDNLINKICKQKVE